VSIGLSSGALWILAGATVCTGDVPLAAGAAGFTPSAGRSSRRDTGAGCGAGVGLPKMPTGGATTMGGLLLGSATKTVCPGLTTIDAPARFWTVMAPS
jgi:hypothetical protein